MKPTTVAAITNRTDVVVAGGFRRWLLPGERAGHDGRGRRRSPSRSAGYTIRLKNRPVAVMSAWISSPVGKPAGSSRHRGRSARRVRLWARR